MTYGDVVGEGEGKEDLWAPRSTSSRVRLLSLPIPVATGVATLPVGPVEGSQIFGLVWFESEGLL